MTSKFLLNCSFVAGLEQLLGPPQHPCPLGLPLFHYSQQGSPAGMGFMYLSIHLFIK